MTAPVTGLPVESTTRSKATGLPGFETRTAVKNPSRPRIPTSKINLAARAFMENYRNTLPSQVSLPEKSRVRCISVSHSVPTGRSKITHSFKPGTASENGTSPDGTEEIAGPGNYKRPRFAYFQYANNFPS